MELYKFSMSYVDNSAQTALYTSGTEDYEYNSEVYVALPVSRGEISFEFETTDLSITMPSHLWPAVDFKIVNPYGVVSLKVYSPAGLLLFSGSISSATFNIEKGSAKLIVTSIQEVLDSSIPVKVYSPACPYELYGSRCGLSQLAHLVSVTISGSSIVGTTVTNVAFSGYDDGHFAGGWIETDLERVTIITHIGSTITLLYEFKSLAGSDNLSVYPGCDKLITTCDTVYNNISKFGGFPWVPLSNPVTEEF